MIIVDEKQIESFGEKGKRNPFENKLKRRLEFYNKHPFEDDSRAVFFDDIKESVTFYKKEKIKKQKDYFNEIKTIFKKYLDTSELNYDLLSIWCLGTYFHSKFNTYPLMCLNARKQSGKTRTLKLLSALCWGSDGSVSTSVTETFLFRHNGGALFFDELESLSRKEKGGLRELINATYKKGNKIIRYKEEKGNYIPQEFFPYYPIGLCAINFFGDVLEDRSISLILTRSNRKQTKLIEDFSTNETILDLKKELNELEAEIPQAVFTEWNNFVEYRNANPELKPLFQKISNTELSARDLEKFFPLFIIAEKFGVLETIIETSKEYIKQLEGAYLDNSDDLLQMFMEKRQYKGYVNISTILTEFKATMEEPEDYINSKWLGRALKRLGLVKSKRKVTGKVQVELVELVDRQPLVERGIKNNPNIPNYNNNNSTNPTNTTNTTNTTNSTNNKEGSVVSAVCVVCGEEGTLTQDGKDFYCAKCGMEEFGK